MIEVKINGVTKWQVNEYTFNDPQMGIRSINMTVKHPSMWVYGIAPEVADFTGAYVEYNGERFDITSSKPTAEKTTSTVDYTYTLIFKGGEDVLTRRKVRDLAEVGVDNYVSQGTIFRVPLTLSGFGGLLQRNLNYYFNDEWTVIVDGVSSDEVWVDVNNSFLWDLLLKSYEYYNKRFKVEGKTIYIGYEPTQIDHIFDYGGEGGLVNITRTAQDTSIINRLIGTGGSRNVPVNYFSNTYENFNPDPNPISGLQRRITNIMPKVFRDSVRNGTVPYVDYVEDIPSILANGVREGALPPNEDIYPTISGVTVAGLGRIDELIAVEIPEGSDPDAEDYVGTFDIWVKDIGFNLAEDKYTTTEDAKISFTNGVAMGYEFVILAVNGVRQVTVDTTKTYGGVASKYKITLIRSDEDLAISDKMIPNDVVKPSAGNNFVIYNINLPQSYVENAELRVQTWLESKVEELKKENPTFTVEPMDSFFETADVELDGKTIKEKLKAGNKIYVNNTKVTDGLMELHINHLTIKYGGILPKYTFTVTDKVQVGGGAVSRLQSQLDAVVSRQLFTQMELDAILDGTSSRYISKMHPDGTNYYLRLRGGAEFGSFSSGMFTGKGGRIDDKGNAELESLVIRSLLEVPEIRYNRLTLVGEEIAIGAGGIILDVWQEKDEETGEVVNPNSYTLKMKLEEGEFNPFFEHDIVKGIFNQVGAFRTSWFRVNSVNHGDSTMVVTLGSNDAVPAGANFPPQPFMNIARVGNFVDPTRQSSIFLSAREGNIVMYDAVDNFMGGFRSFQLGKPDGLENIIDFDKFSQINKDHGYLYARGIMVQDIIEVDYLGAPVRAKRDRGVWSLETAQSDMPYAFTDKYQDTVWMGWSRYLCIVDGTTEKPSEGATDWVMDYSIEDAFNESIADISDGLDAAATKINAAEKNITELDEVVVEMRDVTLKAMEDNLISESERRSLYAIYVRLDIEQEQLLSDVMYAINSIYMPPIYKGKLTSISDKFLSAGGSLDQYQVAIDAILDHADPHITDYEREEYNRTLAIYTRDHKKLVEALRDSRLAIDAEIKRLANQKTEEVEGGKNLLRNYDQRWDFDFWGGDGISVDIDLDAIIIVNQRGLIDDGNLIEDESGNIIELV